MIIRRLYAFLTRFENSFSDAPSRGSHESENRLTIVLSLVCTTATAQSGSATDSVSANLMPLPLSSLQSWKTCGYKIIHGCARGSADPRLKAAIDRALRRIEGRTVMELARGLAGDAAVQPWW